MTEAEWLVCKGPLKMWRFLRGKGTERQRRLFICACARHVWHLLTEKSLRRAVELAERFIDGQATQRQCERAHHKAMDATLDNEAFWTAVWAGDWDLERATYCVCRDAHEVMPRAVQATLLRDVFGNPFRASTIDPAWLAWHDGVVKGLAQSAYHERDPYSGHLDSVRLSVLADALEEAGCADDFLLSHLRAPGPHVRGCWVVDNLLA